MKTFLKQAQFFIESRVKKDKLLHDSVGSLLAIAGLLLYYVIWWVPAVVVFLLPGLASVVKEFIWLWLFRVPVSWADVLWSSYKGALIFLVLAIWG
jgi:hypothetical protein